MSLPDLGEGLRALRSRRGSTDVEHGLCCVGSRLSLNVTSQTDNTHSVPDLVHIASTSARPQPSPWPTTPRRPTRPGRLPCQPSRQRCRQLTPSPPARLTQDIFYSRTSGHLCIKGDGAGGQKSELQLMENLAACSAYLKENGGADLFMDEPGQATGPSGGSEAPAGPWRGLPRAGVRGGV
jgi:hypothetical protein